ncbi:mechanosensitive ion channel family protein [Costertonia aggregata]|uniref:Mechanosensitive ion channel n=1 Tax=Costertonia aggregata TaxID=343403 RepID=A0A7H9AND1_9FLAO|nr:mechanosensitive ion channel domain-containing protein [Costertonia aggregata]QLG44940.1 mechanosensitive ion channel [Costertonia aggregata]
MEDIGNLATKSLTSILEDIVGVLPGILGAIIVITIGWIIIKIIAFVLKKILRLAKIGKLSDKINDAKLFGDESEVKIDISKLIIGFIKGFLWLTFIIVASDVMGLDIISTEIANLLRYLPVLLSAIVIFMIGMFAAKLIKNALVNIFDSMGVGGSKIVSGIIYYIILIFVMVTALNQAGIDTAIITSNITMILGAFLLAFAIALGLGAREVVGDLLRTFYARKSYAIGDKIKTKKVEGTIEDIDSISVTIKTEKGKIVLPIKKLTENTVEIE